MKEQYIIELFKVGYQFYIIPTIKTTYSRELNGHYEIQLIWLNRGLSFMF